ncbi:MAG: hypothetical protein FK734_20655 [Asgard group archaeon]|nr:hypothetical protein [Asgard group archaeon]
MIKSRLNSKSKLVQFTLIIILVLSLFITIQQFNYTPVRGHNQNSEPIELFSIWNDTSPYIDGTIDFTPYDLSGEWSSAAVYDVYNYLDVPRGKLLVQNNNDTLCVAIDITTFTIRYPSLEWGAAVYLDLDHNGFASQYDYIIKYLNISSVDTLELYSYNPSISTWDIVETGSLGIPMTISGIIFDTSFGKSAFNNASDHRMYEIEIPYTLVIEDRIIGFGVEATTKETTATNSGGWPFIETGQKDYRTNPQYWGDLHLGHSNNFVEFVIEDNFNIKDEAIGYNNGTFLGTGDINGDGDLELIVSSNRTVSGDGNLLAIYDYVGGAITRIWESWLSSQSSYFTFAIRGIECYDFDEDGKDEIYAVGDSQYILRLFDWNTVTKEFDSASYCFDNFDPLTGYIAIGDADNIWDGSVNIVISDVLGYLGVLNYRSNKDDFIVNGYWTLPDIAGLYPVTKIHDVEIADMDNEEYYLETLMLSQFTADDSLSYTALQIVEFDTGTGYDNPTNAGSFHEDDLPITSSPSTYDAFGHTIVVEDVDNDGVRETIIVGRYNLKIFGYFTFSLPSPPLELILYDSNSQPDMAGGAGVFDIDGDAKNELIVGCSNGTVIIYEITDNNSDPDVEDLSYVIEWSGDLGTSPGMRNSIIGLDIDKDGDTEAIITDNFGQIIVLGKGTTPEITITSPTSGFVTNQETVFVTWEMSTNSLPIHHYDIYVNESLTTRAGSGQTGAYVAIQPGTNYITVTAYDITNKSDSYQIKVVFGTGSPEVVITNPTNNFATKDPDIEVSYLAYDPQFDPVTFTIYLNDSVIATGISTLFYDLNLEVDGSGDGVYNITVIAIDSPEGNIGLDTVFVIYGNVAPLLNITSPSDGAIVKVSSIDIEWDSSDLLTGIDYFEVLKDGILQGSTSYFYYTVNLNNDKEYNFTVIAYDKVGNMNSKSISIIRDMISPTVSFIAPSLPMTPDGVYYTEYTSLFVEWIGSDQIGGSGVDYYELEINGELYETYSATDENDTLIFAEEGLKEILITIYDKAGNLDIDLFELAVDFTNPTISIISPYNNYITSSDNVTVSWIANDLGAGIKEYNIYVNGTLIYTIDDDLITTYILDISIDANYTVEIEAVDYLDRTNSDIINVIHDPLQPTFYIIDPITNLTYTSILFLNMTWGVINIIPELYCVFVDGIPYQNYTADITNILIDLELILGTIAPDDYRTINITVAIYISGSYYYQDTKWFTIDQTAPIVNIVLPLVGFPVTEETLFIDWTGRDDGTAIYRYRVYIEDELVGTFTSSTTQQYVDISDYLDGEYTITVVATDLAGNVANTSRTVFFYPSPPEFDVSIEETMIINNGDFQFDLIIIDPHFGVAEIQIEADATNTVYYTDFGGTIQHTTFSLPINVSESNFVGSGYDHNLTITVIDQDDRGSYFVSYIVLDKVDPDIIPNSAVINSQLLSLISNSIEIREDSSNLHNFSIAVSDLYGISGVDIRITGDDFNQTYNMNYDLELSNPAIYYYYYYISIDFSDFNEGNYYLQFIITDTAGNEMTSLYQIGVAFYQPQTTPPPTSNPGSNWFQENMMMLIYIGAGALAVIILSSIVAVTVKKRNVNKGWKKAVDAVAYVAKTGLTVTFVPYSPDLFDDSQLFGGAMTGILGILAEITGQSDSLLTAQVIEYGEKRLIICPGYFGNAILLMNDVKEIHKETLKKFIVDFEINYKYQLSNELINLNDFDAVPLLVESYFGIRPPSVRQLQNQEPIFEQLG